MGMGRFEEGCNGLIGDGWGMEGDGREGREEVMPTGRSVAQEF